MSQVIYYLKKSVIIGVRVDPAQATKFVNAAKAAGKHVSTWIRDVAIAAIEAPALPMPGVEIIQTGGIRLVIRRPQTRTGETELLACAPISRSRMVLRYVSQ